MKQPSHRQLIIKGINDVVIPYFENLGFSLESSLHVTILGDSRSLYPIGCLTRFSEDGTMDIIEFKFGKYKNSGFEINFAQILKSGAHWDFGYSPQSETSAYGFGSFGVYQKSRVFSFSNFCTYTFKFNSFRAINQGILKARKYAHEIEAWFQTGKVGPRLRTQEKIDKGITICRGWPKYFFLRSVDAGYMTPPDSDRIFFSRSDVESYSVKQLFKQNRNIKFGIYWPWQTIKH